MSDAKATPGEPLLNSLLSSGTKADLLILFHRNPGLIDTIDGIARRIGKKGDAITPEISQLEVASILNKKRVGKSDVYFLNREKDRQAQSEIASYINAVGASKTK